MNQIDVAGIEINQNQLSSTTSDFITASTEVYQTFHLPVNFVRGTTDVEKNLPPLSGFQLCITTDTLDIQIDYGVDVFYLGEWVELTSGTSTGTYLVGDKVWTDVYFPDSVEIDPLKVTAQYRLRLTTDTEIWFSSPNPFPNDALFVTDENQGVSLRFRLLTGSGDKGVDFLGNNFRASLNKNQASNITTVNTPNPDTFWLSKPNPSKFAIECLYFDLSESGQATVFDRIVLDPMTPGVYFHVYYSSEGDPGVTSEDWASKLWTPVLTTFHLTKKDEFAMPNPITARYVCIEFSMLQAKYYSAGTFQQPIRYQKYPKWVLDYFLATQVTSEDPFVANNVNVIYDFMDLAYNYYLDDLQQDPDNPVTLSQADLVKYLTSGADVTDQIDSTTLQKITTTLNIWTDDPGARSAPGSSVVSGIAPANQSYPSETNPLYATSSLQVSTTNRDDVLMQQTYPVMYYFLTCRHTYKEVQATHQYDRAYFVGIKQVAFNRDHYASVTDTPLYIEGTGDNANVLKNDFLQVNGQWQILDD